MTTNPTIPPPTSQDKARDLAADWATCQAATPDGFQLGRLVNPDPSPGEGDFWHARTKFHRTVPKEVAERYLCWCKAARTGWEAALRLLHAERQARQAAEAEISRLKALLSQQECS